MSSSAPKASGAYGQNEREQATRKEIVKKMRERMLKEFSERKNETNKFSPRILLLGPTGVGKSSLVNTVFGLGKTEQAQVRAGGAPCTQDLCEYGPFENIPVSILDSKGIEMAFGEKQTKEIVKYVRNRNNDIEPRNHIHVAWYVPRDRWEQSDIEFIKQLREIHLDVVIVITKCDQKQQIDKNTGVTALELTKREIRKSFESVPIVECATPPEGSPPCNVPKHCSRGPENCDGEVLTSMKTGKWSCNGCGERGRGKVGPWGYVELVDYTIEAIPEIFRSAFRKAQVVDMKKKNAEATGIIAAHTLVAMGVGALPIPYPDLPFLLGIEASLGAMLFYIYDIDPSLITAEDWMKLNASIIGVAGTVGSGFAKFLKSTVLFAPVGAAVDATVAGGIVATLGVAIATVGASLPPRCSSSLSKQEMMKRLEDETGRVNVWNLVEMAYKSVTSSGSLSDEFAGRLQNIIDTNSSGGNRN